MDSEKQGKCCLANERSPGNFIVSSHATHRKTKEMALTRSNYPPTPTPNSLIYLNLFWFGERELFRWCFLMYGRMNLKSKYKDEYKSKF